MAASPLNDAVRTYWESETCGTGEAVTGEFPRHSPEWFARIEANRYALEPYIHAEAQFTRHYGKKILEVGVGAGTDHLQWARAGCICHGVDLTDAAIKTAARHLALHGFSSDLRRIDAESLPFPDASFDVVYSWGVIHHSEKPESIVSEIHRVMKPGGEFIGMVYNRHSLAVFRLWILKALFKGRPWYSLRDVAWRHIESIGTKTYTHRELRALFGSFSSFESHSILCHSDTHRLPYWLANYIPHRLGFFRAVHASK